MQSADDQPTQLTSPIAALQVAAYAAGVASAWAAGTAGWDALAAAWGVSDSEAWQSPPAAARCWWDSPPWHGQIADDEFRTIVALYAERYGSYTPDLPEREPGLLRAWLSASGRAPAPQVAA